MFPVATWAEAREAQESEWLRKGWCAWVVCAMDGGVGFRILLGLRRCGSTNSTRSQTSHAQELSFVRPCPLPLFWGLVWDGGLGGGVRVGSRTDSQRLGESQGDEAKGWVASAVERRGVVLSLACLLAGDRTMERSWWIPSEAGASWECSGQLPPRRWRPGARVCRWSNGGRRVLSRCWEQHGVPWGDKVVAMKTGSIPERPWATHRDTRGCVASGFVLGRD